MKELFNEVARKSLKSASELLDYMNRKGGWMHDDARLVRDLVDIAVVACSAILRDPFDSVTVSGFFGVSPEKRELDRKELADAIKEILKEEAESHGDMHYT